MMLRILIIIIFFTSLFMGQSNSPVEQGKSKTGILSLSLKEVREYAVKHSTATKNARLDVSMAQKKIWETTAAGLPQISAKISYMNNLQIPTTLIPAKFIDPDAADDEYIGVKFGTQHNASGEITANQLIFSGSYIVALQASKIYLRLSQNQSIKSEIDVKETVTNTYYLILLAEDNKRTLEGNLENLKKTLFETQELLKAGFAEDTDADQVHLAVLDLENAIQSIKYQVDITYNLLKFQVGFDMNQEIRLSETLDDFIDQIDTQEMINSPFNLFSHIDYRSMDTLEKSMGLLYKRQKTEFLPTISAFISHSQSAMRESFNFFSGSEKWFPSTMIGVNIGIPVFSSGMRLAQVAQARMEWEKSKNNKQQVENGLKLEYLQAKSTFEATLDKSRNTEKNVELAKRIYEKTLSKYSSGVVSSLELTQIHNQYLTAESNHTRALVDFLNAKTRLDKILNRL